MFLIARRDMLACVPSVCFDLRILLETVHDDKYDATLLDSHDYVYPNLAEIVVIEAL